MSSGVLFYFCYVINAAFNATAFVEDIMSTFFPHLPSAYTYYWYHGTCTLLLIVALNGAGAFAKVNIFLFVVLFSAVVVTFGSLTFGESRCVCTLYVRALPLHSLHAALCISFCSHFAVLCPPHTLRPCYFPN